MPESLIDYKTNAWQDAKTVDWYSARMLADDATFQLKNKLEIETIKRFVVGKDIVDIGIGTGRASLPLLNDGYRITGIDSSQAMLDETRRLARGMPIDLRVGDVTHLPCPDRSFDCAVSLNVLVHFPTWKEALREWKRVLRPGGCIIFDVHSWDHVVMAYGGDPERWPQALRQTAQEADPYHYMQRVGMEELVSFADDAGFSIVEVVPYGAFLGGGNINWLLYESLERDWSWKRLLSWFSRDEKLSELGFFLEQMIIAHLSPMATGRMFVVLENKSDVQRNLQFARNLKIQDAAILNNDITENFRYFPLTRECFLHELGSRCETLRCQGFLYFLLSGLKERFPLFDFSSFLPPFLQELFAEWDDREQMNQQGMKIVRGWAKDAEFRFKNGVDLALGCEYDLMRDLLVQYFGAWGENRR